jgi:hypothetical protein
MLFRLRHVELYGTFVLTFGTVERVALQKLKLKLIYKPSIPWEKIEMRLVAR